MKVVTAINRVSLAVMEVQVEARGYYLTGDPARLAKVREQVAAHGFPFALGTEAGLYRHDGDPLNLPRFGVSQRNACHPELLAWRIRRGARS